MHRHHSIPLLTVGMPVYNGANFISQAIASILSQSFTDFELIICDNASTDETAEICEGFAGKDKRIRYIRSSENIGASANFNKVFYEGKGKYFKWMAHDDELDSGYLEQCINVLEKRNDTVLCNSQVNVIDGAGAIIRHDFIDPLTLSSDIASQRFNALLRTDLDNYEIFGVIRRDVLEKTPLIGGYIASDRTLRAEIGLHGKFNILPDPLFLCRDHPARSIRAMPTHHTRGEWFNPQLKGRFIFPHWRIITEYFKCIGRVGHLSSHEKNECRMAVLKWLGVHQNWARLVADLFLVLFPGMENFFIRCGKVLAGDGGRNLKQ
jgi:glycosyltransferase involved in cell wall biosynthesis